MISAMIVQNLSHPNLRIRSLDFGEKTGGLIELTGIVGQNPFAKARIVFALVQLDLFCRRI